jgi:glycosyltransferase involved in cell wall biosynthesis
MSRVVMFVLNDCRTDARVLREAATLAAAGHVVTVVARTTDPYAARGDEESRDGFRIVRVPVAAGILRWLLLGRRPRTALREAVAAFGAALRRPPRGWIAAAGAVLVAILLAVPAALAAAALLVLQRLTRTLRPLRTAWSGLEWRLQWRFGVMPWTAAAVAAAPAGDVFHAHDMRALPAAVAARARERGVVVYDSHEIFVEAGANAKRPAWAKRGLRRRERCLSQGAAALVTVNDELAANLGRVLGIRRVVVVRNCPPRWTPPAAGLQLLRAATGVGADEPVVLYHGALAPHRGIEQLAAALREPDLDGVHLVVLGMGPMRGMVAAMASDPTFGGRLHLVDAVPPFELPAWIAGADVGAMPIQPSTLNHRLSTPNKLFECLGAGVPVVTSDFAAMRGIVMGDPDGPLGAVCDPADPRAIAAAIRGVLALAPAARADLRARCLRAAHARYAWEQDAAVLLALYASLENPGAKVAAAG